MLRQRLRERTSPAMFVGRLVTLILALALVWYGLMTFLLAVKVSPSTVDSISGYRTAFDWLSELTPADVDGTTTRAIVAAAGVAAFLVFGYLALKQLPRTYLTRHDLDLTADDQGEVVVAPRAIERLAESAAISHPAVTRARGRYSVDDLTVDLTIRRARDLAGSMNDAQERVASALRQHELPTMPVNITLTGYERRQRRDLQ
jgi:hypothetical protein